MPTYAYYAHTHMRTHTCAQTCSTGAEALVRTARSAHPSSCKDVGYAALRDLGLDNYAS